jgi:hypothetical protein
MRRYLLIVGISLLPITGNATAPIDAQQPQVLGTFYPFVHGRFTREPGPVRPWTSDGNVERCYHPPYDCPAVAR